MALEFDGGISHRVSYANAADIDDLMPFTFWCWVYPTTFVQGMRLYDKGPDNIGITVGITGADGQWRAEKRTSGTNRDYRTTANPLVINTWNFVAVRYDRNGGNDEKFDMYLGDLSTVLAEVTYSATTEGNGTDTSDAGDTANIGNRGAASDAFVGRYANFGLIDAGLTIDDLKRIQFNPGFIHPSTVIYSELGYNGIGTQPDLSGLGHAGTINGGMAVVPHVPLRPRFGYDLEWDMEEAAAAAAVLGGAYYQQYYRSMVVG